MWANKYRPVKLEDTLLNPILKKKLINFVKTKNIPNVILSGKIGGGKSAILACIMRELYQNNIGKYAYRINSSVEKNIKLIKEQLEQFCRMKNEDNIKRLIIVDDVDFIPEKVQLVITSMMQRYDSISFIFTCCNTGDICESIQSNCIMMHIEEPTKEEFINRMKEICILEHYKYNDDALDRIYFLSQRDLRLAINTIQSICIGFGELSIANINKICDIPNLVIVSKIIYACIKNDVKFALKETTQLFDDGYSGIDILSCMFDVLRNSDNIEDIYKIPMMSIIGKSMYKISRKIDSSIQLNKCIVKICNFLSAKT